MGAEALGMGWTGSGLVRIGAALHGAVFIGETAFGWRPKMALRAVGRPARTRTFGHLAEIRPKQPES